MRSEKPDQRSSKSSRTVAKNAVVEFAKISDENQDDISYLKKAFRHLMRENHLVGFGLHGQVFGRSVGDVETNPKHPLLGSISLDLKGKLTECMLDCREEQETIITTLDLQKLNRRFCVIAIPFSQFTNVDTKQAIQGVVAFAFISTSHQSVQLMHSQLRCDMWLAISHLPTAVGTASKDISQKNLDNNSQTGGSDPRFKKAKNTKQVQGQESHSNDALAPELTVTGNIGKIGSTREFAFKLVHEFVKNFRCQQVAIGIAKRNAIEVFAVSGLENFKANSPGIVDIQQAMDEAYDSKQIIAHQFNGRFENIRSLPIHENWSQESHSSVCSIPLMAGEECVAVISLSKPPETGFKEAEIDAIKSSVESFGPAIQMSLRGDRTLLGHMTESLFQMLAPKSFTGILIRFAFVLGIVYFCLGTMPYRPATECELSPAGVSQTTAPFDVKLLQCLVRSGEAVKKGQVLAVLDSQQLELEQESLVARIEQLNTDVRKALNDSDVAAAYLAKSNAAALEHELSVVRTKIALCTIVAPSDGIVVEANLEQKIGQVFPQGERILTFSPMKNWELTLKIPESLSRDIQKDQTGDFCLNAWPDQSFPYRIISVAGGAEMIDGKNVLVAKAAVEESTEFFRQGMEGIAKTNASRQRIWWVTFRGAYEYLHQNFWF